MIPFCKQVPAELPEVVSPGMLGRHIPQDEHRGRFDEENILLKQCGVKLDAVYIGDSLTAGWPVENLLRDLFPHAVNRGVGGDSARFLKERLEADVLQLHPRHVALMIGTNDIAHRFGYDDDDKIAADYRSDMDNIMSRLAQTDAVCFIGTIPPVIQEFLDDAPRSESVMYHRKKALIPRMNEAVKDLAKQHGMHLADYHTHFSDENGVIPKSFFADSCHFNAKGKHLMTLVLRHTVERVLHKSI